MKNERKDEKNEIKLMHFYNWKRWEYSSIIFHSNFIPSHSCHSSHIIYPIFLRTFSSLSFLFLPLISPLLSPVPYLLHLISSSLLSPHLFTQLSVPSFLHPSLSLFPPSLVTQLFSLLSHFFWLSSVSILLSLPLFTAKYFVLLMLLPFFSVCPTSPAGATNTIRKKHENCSPLRGHKVYAYEWQTQLSTLFPPPLSYP